jgi:hypothetical protein
MRRTSDHSEGQRTGVGRRARDRILAGQTRTSPVLQRAELTNLVLFLGDDLRESALAVGGIESFLVRAQKLLEDPALTPEDLRSVVDDPTLAERFELLADALDSLRKSMRRIHESLT